MSRYNITRYCTQHDNLEGKTSVRLWTHERHPYLAIAGKPWLSFVNNLKKVDRNISGANCIYCSKALDIMMCFDRCPLPFFLSYVCCIISFQEQEPQQLTHLPLDKMAAILADGTLKCIFLNENDIISIQMSLKFVPRSPIDSQTALVQVMAWRWIGDKPLCQQLLAQFIDVYMRQ